MKKIYAAAFLLAFFSRTDAQVLNQSAGWPNPAWSITGTYNTDPLAFEADPTASPNFAYDDDDAGNPHEDNIAAESPVIDLTAAFAANEKNITITTEYGYFYLADDVLQFQYWDATAMAWVAWPGANIPGNDETVTDVFCTIPKTTYITNPLSIADFTPAQLAGFKYRIFYDDNISGTDWNYGFCFDSPTITSSACQVPTTLASANVTADGADISWDPITGITGFEYVLDQSEEDPTSGTPTTDNTYVASDLDPSSTYFFHLRTDCGSSQSDWITLQITTTAEIPANDSCATAIAIDTMPYTNSLDASAATADGVIDICSGMNDGVWYTFVGTGNDVAVEITDILGWDPELGVYTGTCGGFVCVDQIDAGGTDDGEELLIPATVQGTTYYINVGHYGGFSGGSEAEGVFTLNVEEQAPPTPIANDACATATAIASLPYTNTLDATGATNNDGFIAACAGMNDGVWYTFVGTGEDIEIEVTAIDGWDPALGIFTGICGSFNCVDQIDNGGTDGDETYVLSTVGGATYYINVGHYSGTTDNPEGPFTLNVSLFVPPTPIPNDACATAIAITAFPYNNAQDATGATNNDGIISAGCTAAGDMNDGAWYTFVGDGAEITIVVGAPTDWDPQLDIYTGTCGTFTCVGSVDNGATNGDEMLTIESQAGVTYYINVGHYDGFGDEPEGPYVLDVSSALATQVFNSANFRAYPNPVKDVLNVSYENTIDSVSVYNLLGQQVWSETIGAKNAQVNLSSLSQGTYIVKLASNNEVKTMKVLKQ